jgi:glutathione S-transferase
MSFGTAYISDVYPRSAWYPKLAKYLDLDIEFKLAADIENYQAIYMLKRSPLLITSEGFKLSETLAIMNYLVSKSNKPEFAGITPEEIASNSKWISFFTADFIPAMFGRKLGYDERERVQYASFTAQFLDYIEDYLSSANTKFLSSDSILVSDVFVCQVLQHVEELSKFQSLYKYFEAVKSHPIFAEL